MYSETCYASIFALFSFVPVIKKKKSYFYSGIQPILVVSPPLIYEFLTGKIPLTFLHIPNSDHKMLHIEEM